MFLRFPVSLAEDEKGERRILYREYCIVVKRDPGASQTTVLWAAPCRGVSPEFPPAPPGAGLGAAESRCPPAGYPAFWSDLARKLLCAQRCLLQVASSLLAEGKYCTVKQERLEFKKTHGNEVLSVGRPAPRSSSF